MDIFRYFHQKTRRYTWRRKNPVQARLDYIISSNSILNIINSCNIIPGCCSNHSVVEMKVNLSFFERGKRTWNLNCSLLQDTNYIEMVNSIIKSVKQEYSVPVYNLSTMLENEKHLKVSDSQFPEILLLKIRGESIKYIHLLKKRSNAIGRFKFKKKILKNIEI